ncbi:MAG: hypothetical protein KF752_12610 [Pirellulaceae bacterium]|nr:hypothetical protein [Pirellulaceae bacterium]
MLPSLTTMAPIIFGTKIDRPRQGYQAIGDNGSTLKAVIQGLRERLQVCVGCVAVAMG